MKDEILEGIASALHGSNWADRYEESGGSLSQTEILDVMDPITSEAKKSASEIYSDIEKTNSIDLENFVENLFKKIEVRSSRFFSDAELFGYYLGMESLGHGVSWEDDHPPHNLKISFTEFFEDLTFDDL